MKRIPKADDRADVPTVLPVRFGSCAWTVAISYAPNPGSHGTSEGADWVRQVASCRVAAPRSRRPGPGPSPFRARFPAQSSRAPWLLLILWLAAAEAPSEGWLGAQAAPAGYGFTSAGVSAGGGLARGGRYRLQSCMGEAGGRATAPSPAVSASSGRLGQVFEVTDFSLSAQPAEVLEGSRCRIGGVARLGDGTLSVLGGDDLCWQSPPVPAVTLGSDGVLTARNVFEDTTSRIEARYFGRTAALDLRVLNVGDDDFGLYASDRIPDPWQVQAFGVDNPEGAAAADPDGDGQANLAEFLAGVSPTNAASRFVLEIAPIPEQAGQTFLFFSPRRLDRSYAVEYSLELERGFTTLEDARALDFGESRLVFDPAATGSARFYRVRISLP